MDENSLRQMMKNRRFIPDVLAAIIHQPGAMPC